MVRVPVEVRSGSASFRAAVWAESIERALSLVNARYPDAEAQVIFPISEAFFVGGAAPDPEVVRLEAQEEVAV